MGAHALYRSGEAMSVFQELGIPIAAGVLPFAGVAVTNESLQPLPVNTGALLASKLLTWNGKLRFAKLMMMMKRIDPSPLYGMSWKDWIVRSFPRDKGAQQLMLALGRLWTYANCPEVMNAGAIIKQGQTGMDGVYYLHQGWQSLVDSLKKRAEAAGVTFVNGKVHSIVPDGGKVGFAILSNGSGLIHQQWLPRYLQMR